MTPEATPAVGVDLVQVARLADALERSPRLRERLFTPSELSDAQRDGVAEDSLVAVRRLAARFAAKEATRKAFRRSIVWIELEVRTDPDGAPSLWHRGVPTGAGLSLAHDGDAAIAFVVAGYDPRTER